VDTDDGTNGDIGMITIFEEVHYQPFAFKDEGGTERRQYYNQRIRVMRVLGFVVFKWAVK